MTYPLHLQLAGRAVLVAGGGPVAARRVAGALAAGAVVTVVAPEICEDLQALVGAGDGHSGAVRWLAREARADDVAGSWLVHTATGDRATDAELAAAAEHKRIWCVTSGDVELGSARTPAVLRRDKLVLGVSSDVEPDPARAAAMARAVAEAIDTGALPLRRRRGGHGRVVLVGGGPGDVDLITVRGRRALASADVVVHDRLGPSELLAGLDPEVVLIDVGKTMGNHPVPQAEINRVLIERARAGAFVVRLKGGDPFVFGRGSEEAEAVRAAGIEVEVVAGVSSAFAVPLAAGIPVTARGVARGVLVMTGHDVEGAPDRRAATDAARWCARGNTLIVLMGLSTLPRLALDLLAAGLRAEVPVAVIERGTTPQQRTVRTDLRGITQAVAAADLAPPAVIVIGAVAAMGAAVDG